LQTQIKIEKQIIATEQAHDKVLANVTTGDKKLKKAETVDKTIVPGPDQMKSIIEAEKKGYKDVNDLNLKDVHGELAKGSGALKKTETADKTGLEAKDLHQQIKIEKQMIATEQARDKAVAEIGSGEKKLKKSDAPAGSKLPSADEIKAEKEADLLDARVGKVLTDLTKERALKKAETVDKSQLPPKDELIAQIQSEKEAPPS